MHDDNSFSSHLVFYTERKSKKKTADAVKKKVRVWRLNQLDKELSERSSGLVHLSTGGTSGTEPILLG